MGRKHFNFMARTKKDVTPTEETSLTTTVPQSKEVIKTDAEIDSYIAVRQAFIQKVNAICVEGKDYHIIQGKKSLAKGGAEKIASIFKWTAKFEKDTEALEMLGIQSGLVAFKCTLMNGQFVGEGRGAASLQKNGGDPNKTLKMAEKSAFIDSVLRSSGLSDFFTQDIEDMSASELSTPISHSGASSVKMATDKQMALIKDLVQRKRIKMIDLVPIFNWYKPGMKDLSISQAKELIDWLFTYVPKQTTNHIDKDRNIVDGPLPTIQQEVSQDELQGGSDIIDLNDDANKKLADEIGF